MLVLTYTAGGEVVSKLYKNGTSNLKLCWNWEIEEIHQFV
jgi:hypothetical protein